jgi:hypothetical protein
VSRRAKTLINNFIKTCSLYLELSLCDEYFTKWNQNTYSLEANIYIVSGFEILTAVTSGMWRRANRYFTGAFEKFTASIFRVGE